MNRYPLWVYVTITVALVLGALYTLPNFFGEAPAVQVSPARATLKVDQAVLGRVEEALRKAGIQPTGVFLDLSGVKVRLADTDTQLKAKDIIDQVLNPDPANPSYTVDDVFRLELGHHRPGAQSRPGEPLLYRRAQSPAEFSPLARRHQRAADVPRPGSAGRRAFPVAGGHARGDRQAGRKSRRRHSLAAARQERASRRNLARRRHRRDPLPRRRDPRKGAQDHRRADPRPRSEEHTSELQSPCNLVCRLLLEKKKKHNNVRRHN